MLTFTFLDLSGFYSDLSTYLCGSSVKYQAAFAARRPITQALEASAVCRAIFLQSSGVLQEMLFPLSGPVFHSIAFEEP